MFWKRLSISLRLLLVSLAVVVAVAPEWPAFQDERHRLNAIVGQRQFDFLVWEAGALLAKGESLLTAGQAYVDGERRKQFVLEYLDLAQQVRRNEAAIDALYADPAVADPAAASAGLQREVAEQRALLARRQPMAEAIVQEQVAAILVEEGFGLLGRAWPPVQVHMTPLPFILVVSPREEIRQIYGIPLQHGLELPAQEEMEAAVGEVLDHSALVVPIGGLGLYPAMIVETGSINFLADVVAHEWAHHWLTLHPLGLSYAASPALRTINETVASIIGTEVGAGVIERFYPEFALSADEEQDESPPDGPGEAAPFEFDAEMAATRIRVDELLAEGRVAEAEAYMEERRRFFWDHGYHIRKLNQAYFAFYGAYADTPGEAGADPIGPMLLAIRESSPSLREFVRRVAVITSLEHLEALHGSGDQAAGATLPAGISATMSRSNAAVREAIRRYSSSSMGRER